MFSLLDPSGVQNLAVLPLAHGSALPSKILVNNDFIYYRYSVMNGVAETGYHKLSRYNLSTKTDDEILIDPAISGKNLEILSFDVNSDDTSLYFTAMDYDQNAVIFGSIDLSKAGKRYTSLKSDTSYNTITVF